MSILSVKTKITKNIQNNLNSGSIKRLLRIISSKPVLALYVSSIKSITDRYLNIYTIRYMNEVYSGKYPVAYGSLFLPYELINGLNLKPFLPEVMGGFTAGLGVTDKTLKTASNKWYSSDLCTFHRSAAGACEMDLFPKPSFIFCSNLACDAAGKSFLNFAKKYDIEDRYYLIDVPHENDNESINFLSQQLEHIFYDVSKKLNKKPDLEKLRQSINHSNNFRKFALEANEIRRNLFDYPQYFNGLNYILPFFGLCGTEETVNLFKIMKNELRDKLLKQDKNKKMKKVLWMHLKPYYKNEIFNILEKNNCRVVFEETSFIFWDELNPDKPFESLAKKMLSNPLRGNGGNRIKAMQYLSDYYDIDGVIMFSHWGCRQSNGLSRLVKESFNSKGIPVLVLDGDCVDINNCPAGQIKTRVEGFAEILNSI
ncbi:MAG: 2-hydroxyacyl-CoA dehydratase family protein [Actinobacteria bacterium]|nr:2-hydroxyacyl-CoA dehydratase family protein [Cyanobacteriota bacterium]MCL5771228.1 2-hydroxyacyl-CoA dehydratase family protein [Actinomycetota bacterium]